MTGYIPTYYKILTKTALKAAVKAGKELPVINPTPWDQYERVENASGIAIVGPDPYLNRKWFAQVDVSNGIIVKVK